MALNMESTTTDTELPQIRISVHGLVDFLLRSGDIDNRRHVGTESAMQQGSKIHRMIQKRMGPEYEPEVSLRLVVPGEGYCLSVEGRADGIITAPEGVTVDEIKGTYRSLERMKAPVPEHLAQAKCYAYIYALQQSLPEIRVRLTYCNMESEEIRYFYADFSFRELEEWFLGLIEEYRRWADLQFSWTNTRQASIQNLPFPYPYRKGQKELAIQVYQTIAEKKKLFLEAPTGVGKTLTTVYPAVQAVGRNMADRIFYLTAKTITRTVAEESFGLLREKGLHFKSVVLTAKEKLCLLDRPDCNPESCPRAKGHYDRINEALYALVSGEETMSREVIEEYAERYQVCPFELMLDASLFCDAIIGDYNYLFDPHVRLKRFFAEGGEGSYIFLIDEAHNLVDRGREMYSALLYRDWFFRLARSLKREILTELSEEENAAKKTAIPGQMSFLTEEEEEAEEENPLLKVPDRELPASFDVSDEQIDTIYRSVRGARRHRGGSRLVREGYAEKMVYRLEETADILREMQRDCNEHCVLDSIDELNLPLMKFYGLVSDYLEEHEEKTLPIREEILDLFFEVSHFLEMWEQMDENYITYCQIDDEKRFFVKLFCVHPGNMLAQCMGQGRSSILFSATLLPIQYYKNLLGGKESDYEVYAHSVFDPGAMGLMIARDVTSLYQRRNREEYVRIARYISEITAAKPGNYLLFFPSHSFLDEVLLCYEELFLTEDQTCICQTENMNEAEREDFLRRFSGDAAGKDSLSDLLGFEIEEEEAEQTLLGFCVMGGIFSEGIDLKEDRLIGVIVVGTGIPLVCFEREILKDYFDREGSSGFDYAYRFPGMNKVLQAAGRVIRTENDRGVVALLDERFLQPSYVRLFPREWEKYGTVSVDEARAAAKHFWDRIQ